MTREEQIQKLIDEENGIDNYGTCDYQVGVCDGVRLADKTIIDKACEWLYNNTYKTVGDGKVSTVFRHTVDMIEDFRKSMEE